jgi:Cys-rich four helix bundle protein (predicted Tat secretion target)
MDRREFLTGALTATVAAAAASGARAQGAGSAPGTALAAAAAPARDPKLDEAARTARACLEAGDACVRHCVALLGQGDTTLEKCMRTVLDMTAACEGLARLASWAESPTPNLRAYAKVCGDYCRDCSAACRKHADHHAPCKACMESCDACLKACEALAA